MDEGRSSPMAILQSPLSRSSSLRVSLNRTSLVRRNQSMNAKQIRFFRNGDRYFCGLKLAVSVERYKEFESLLAELSKKLDLPTGAVRYVFNAENSSIITDISQLQYGIPYVCSSIHSFRQIEGGYGKHMKNWSIISKHAKIENNTSFTKPTVLSNSTSENIIHYNHQNRMEVMREFIKPKLVTVIRNGKPPQKKVTLLLNNKTAISLNQVLDQLSARGSLGKVDKLYTVDCRVVKTLRDLFDDDTVFIALQANEKFPEDGIELDPNSYRITPYRELKRPSSMNVKRSQSLRSSIRRFAKEDSQNISSLMAKNNRPNTSLNGKLGNTNKVARAKNNSNKQIDQNNDELYPTSVFESESSDSDCEYELNSMFGIKRDKQSVHSCYKIGRIIGDGNFAIVRECRNRKSQRSYALKVINKSKVKGKEHMIENEILILRKISHPNIVKLHDEFETAKEIFLVMELVTGGDLFDAIVANTRFSEPDSAFMIRDLAAAVKYLHEKSIIHRDIKPENLLVVHRADGRKSIKLADFGLSIEVNSPMFLVCGTPTYVAPEILDESGYGLKVDCWAIGVISYILLCGFPPFRSSNHDQEELFDKILNGDFEYLSPFWDDVSDGPRDLIDRLLVVDASERYEAHEVNEHFWIKKWTRPTEKLHRELSEVEDQQSQRKRLRGVALAIHAVISLLWHVRAKRRLSVSTKQYLTEQKVMHKSTPAISRIPLPKPSVGFHISTIRRNMAEKKKDAPCTFKKGHYKREEVINKIPVRSARMTVRNRDSIKTTNIPSPVPNRRIVKLNDTQKKRPVSLYDTRYSRSNDSDFSVTESSSSASSISGTTTTTGVKLRQKTSKRVRPRPHSMVDVTNTRLELEGVCEDMQKVNLTDVRKYEKGKQSGVTSKITKIENKTKASDRQPSRKDSRPNTLTLNNNTKKNSPHPRSFTPNSYDANKQFTDRSRTPQRRNPDYRSSSAPRVTLTIKTPSRSPVKRLLASTNSTPTKVTINKNKPSTPSHQQHSPKKAYLSSRAMSVNDVSRYTENSPSKYALPHWNFSTKPDSSCRSSMSAYHEDRRKKSPRKTSISKRTEMNSPTIQITTHTNKVKNVRHPDGKETNRETKTTTTFSVDMLNNSPTNKTTSGDSLLKRVKNLAQEIECLSKVQESSSDSNFSNSEDTILEEYTVDSIKEETDRFSETEYLSVANQCEDSYS